MRMRTLSILLLGLVLLNGCSRTNDPLAGYASASGDLTPFALDYAVRCGARPLNTKGLPKIEAKWRYKTDKDGVQIYVVGDYLSQVQSCLLAAFGPPAIPVKTNADGHVSGGVYAAPATGAAIQFCREDSPDGTRSTKVVIVRQGALKP
jgi:hypothetical protein